MMTNEEFLAEAREVFMESQNIVETYDGCLHLTDDDPLEILRSTLSDTALCRWRKPEGDVELWVLAHLSDGWEIRRLGEAFQPRDEPPAPPVGYVSGRRRRR